MKYISTKQAAEKWGISPRRVALLASQGRIAGTVSMGNTWLIPEDAAKPADHRRKSAEKSTERPGYDFYPYLISTIRSQDQLSALSPEERDIYRACVLFEAGEFRETQSVAEALLSSENPGIRLGAMYLLTFSSLYLFDYALTDKYAVLFRLEYQSMEAPSPTLRLLFYAFQSEMGNISEFVDSTFELDYSVFSPDLLPLIAGMKLFAELVSFTPGRKLPDTSLYEILCICCDADGYSFSAMYLHLLLSFAFAALGRSDREYSHLRRALALCSEHRFYLTLSCIISASPDTAEKILAEYPAEHSERIREYMDLYVKARTGYAEHITRESPLLTLTESDYRLISCCMRNMSIQQIADNFGLSRSGINRRMSILYEKMGVRSQKELKTRYLNAILDWGK